MLLAYADPTIIDIVRELVPFIYWPSAMLLC